MLDRSVFMELKLFYGTIKIHSDGLSRIHRRQDHAQKKTDLAFGAVPLAWSFQLQPDGRNAAC